MEYYVVYNEKKDEPYKCDMQSNTKNPYLVTVAFAKKEDAIKWAKSVKIETTIRRVFL